MAVSPLVRSFFEEYEQGANSFDVAINQRERAAIWLVANPKGVGVAYNDEQFPERLKHRHEQLMGMGYRSGKLTSLEEQTLDEHYSLVKTAWRQQYEKEGRLLEIAITVDYIVRIDGNTVKIICTIAHEDEEELLRSQGIGT